MEILSENCRGSEVLDLYDGEVGCFLSAVVAAVFLPDKRVINNRFLG